MKSQTIINRGNVQLSAKRLSANFILIALGCFLIPIACFNPDPVPFNPSRLEGAWKRIGDCPGTEGPGCDRFCSFIEFSSGTFTHFYLGNLEKYEYTFQQNTIQTIPGTGGIVSIEHNDAFEFNGWNFPEMLRISSEPPNCDLDGGYTRSDPQNYFIGFTPWHATHLEAEVTTNTYMINELRIALDVVSSLSEDQLEGPAPIEPITIDEECVTATLNRTGTPTNPAGTISIVYEDRCFSVFGSRPRGTITVEYVGRKFDVTSTITIRLINFEMNNSDGGMKLNATYTLVLQYPANPDELRFAVTSTTGSILFSDATTFTHAGTMICEWRRNADPLYDQWVILAGGSKTGNTRDKKSYSTSISDDIVYTRECQSYGIPVSGKEVFLSDSRQFTIDYARTDNNNCSHFVSIEISGRSAQWNISGDGQYPR